MHLSTQNAFLFCLLQFIIHNYFFNSSIRVATLKFQDKLASFFTVHVVNDDLQVKNFILLGDIHKSIYFLSWKEQGSQLNLLAKDFGSLDCLATEFLIDGSTLSLIVSDDQKNVQVGIFVHIL